MEAGHVGAFTPWTLASAATWDPSSERGWLFISHLWGYAIYTIITRNYIWVPTYITMDTL